VILSGHTIADDKAAAKLFNASEYRPVEALGGDGNFIVYDEANDQFRTRRLADNVLAVTMLILDYDGGMSLQSARERFKDYEYVAYTSFSHRRERDVDRYRMIFPLASPIPAAGTFSPFDNLIQGSAWHELEDALKEFAGPCDPVSVRCNQFYYLPVASRAGASVAQVWANSGRPIDWKVWNRVKRAAYAQGTDQDMWMGLYLDKNKRLKPDHILRTQSGNIRVCDVMGRVEGVWCPFHIDKNGTEFVKRIPSNNHVFLYCRRCDRTYWMERVFDRPQFDPHVFVTMDSRTKHADFIDASDHRHVNEQLQRIGETIVSDGKLRGANRSLFSLPTHIVYLPEGSGKSRLAFELAADDNKILFACKSLDQVFEKYEWFRNQARERAAEKANQRKVRGALDDDGEQAVIKAPVNVQLFLSKGAKAVFRFGVDVVRHAPTNPFDAGKIDDEASIQAFKEENPGLSEEFIRLTWHFFRPDKLHFGPEINPNVNSDEDLEDWIAGSQKFKTADIIVTTFAQARLLRLRNQHLPREWTVWFDDPDVSDFSDIEPYDPERWGELSEDEQRAKGIRAHAASGQRYFKRDPRQSLGAAVSRLRCVYTTTEQVTLRAATTILQRRGEFVYTHDKMEGVLGGKITLLGTVKVYSSYDGIIPLMIRRLEKEGHDVRMIADGLSQSLNHTNSKGKNDLAKENLVVELSAPHPLKVKTICDTIGVSFQTEGKGITQDMVLDQLHQALGRNSGYRYTGCECVALIPANLHSAILNEVRYAFDVKNSVIIDRISGMGRRDRRTQDGASQLVLAVEEFLNNFDIYVQDGRKVLPDIKFVLGRIDDEGDRVSYAARLLHALTTLSGIRFDRAPSDADGGGRLYDSYRQAADTVIDAFTGQSMRERVLAGYRRRIGPEEEQQQDGETEVGQEGKFE